MKRRFPFVDLFSGAGGTGTGAAEAVEHVFGMTADMTAINHWPRAIETHTLNHPSARHACCDIADVRPLDMYRRGKLPLMIASPSCVHFSRARGGKPVTTQQRAHADNVYEWAAALRPPVVLIENVWEFREWGPTMWVDVTKKGGPEEWAEVPDPKQKGVLFAKWVKDMALLGYSGDYRLVCSADYGDPTSRARFFMQFALPGYAIAWPEPTHSKLGAADPAGPRLPWVPASEIIEWDVPGRSIFKRKKPLAANTIRRIARGLRKFCFKDFMVPTGYGERKGQHPRLHDVDDPVPTIVGKNKFALVRPFLDKHYSNGAASSIDEPVPTVTGHSNKFAVMTPSVKPFIDKFFGTGVAAGIDEPLDTVTSHGRFGLVAPMIIGQHSCSVARSMDEPVPTVAATGAIGLASPDIQRASGEAPDLLDWLRTDRPLLSYGQRKPPLFHYEGTTFALDVLYRMFTVKELALAQGFRDDYVFLGTGGEQIKQIGNAVTRRTARALVGCILQNNPKLKEFSLDV